MHSMDINAKRGGDLGWFPEGQIHQNFENAVKSHDLGDVFLLDIEERRSFCVILKTFEPKHIEEITILKFTEAID